MAFNYSDVHLINQQSSVFNRRHNSFDARPFMQLNNRSSLLGQGNSAHQVSTCQLGTLSSLNKQQSTLKESVVESNQMQMRYYMIR